MHAYRPRISTGASVRLGLPNHLPIRNLSVERPLQGIASIAQKRQYHVQGERGARIAYEVHMVICC